MLSNAKNAMEEPERSWPDQRNASMGSFIDLDISLDIVPSKFDTGRDTRRSLSSHRPKAKESGKGNAW